MGHIHSMMIALVLEKKSQLAELCQRFKVERLDLFGSATDGTFRTASSDLDFLVQFADRQPTGIYADRYLDLADALEKLFQRPVDLVTEQSIRNPYFRRVVEASKQPVYERSDPQAAV